MFVDVIIILLIILAVVIIIIIWWFRPEQNSAPPVILLDATGINRWQDECGENGEVYKNLTARPMTINVNIRVSNSADCRVDFSTRTNPNFLRLRPILPGRGVAAITLAAGDSITYACASDESGNSCEFNIVLTRM
jgi:hypothetical protein